MGSLIKHLLIILVALMPVLPALAQDTEQEEKAPPTHVGQRRIRKGLQR